jgi:hypothetical protein
LREQKSYGLEVLAFHNNYGLSMMPV